MPQHVADIRKQFLRMKLRGAKPVAGTYEIVGASFIADEPAIFGEVNDNYVLREMQWYYMRSLSVNDIDAPVPKIWRDVASAHGEINSNYGYLMFDEGNDLQYDNVLATLSRSPHGRRATAIYTRPSMHVDWERDGMRDFVCTNAVNYVIRDDALHAVVQMRSNDVVFGYRNDYAWQLHVQNRLVHDYKRNTARPLERGTIYWQAASLHVYERHWGLIK